MQPEGSDSSVAVIGAGITGLTAAYALQQRGKRVHLIEGRPRAGGVIESVLEQGFLVESGPNALLLNDPALLAFFDELGLSGELLEAGATGKKRFIVRGGRVLSVPMSPGEFLRTPLFSARAKLRLAKEPFVPRADPAHEQSVAEFTRHRLGGEVLDYAVDPLVGGIYAGDPEKLSLRHAFPLLFRFEAEQGSLVRGGLHAALSRKKSGKPRFKSRSVSFRGGLAQLTDTLAGRLGDALTLDTSLEGVELDGGFRLRVRHLGEESRELTVDRLVVATPGYAAARLVFQGTQTPLGELGAIQYPPVASVALGFRREDVQHALDGFGVLCPAREELSILGTLFTSSLFAGRAPAGHVLLTSYVGGARRPELALLPKDSLERLVLADLERLLGVRGKPVFSRVSSVAEAIPQYNLGYERFLSAMTEAEQRYPGLFIGGHLRDGASVGDCIRAGQALALRAAA
jgi:oxygen-dependent protoporphyrinogen oxidase